MKTVKLALFGTGTVGSGVIRILQKHRRDFQRHCGVDLEIAAVTSLDPTVAEQYGLGDRFMKADDIFELDDIDIAIELIGGTGFAHHVVRTALERDMHVVTANKALMASSGGELMHLADGKKLFLSFEASVGGGIPIIAPLKHSLVSNEISSVLGIVNGTTNYMLTRMAEDGVSYDEALAQAQANGFAEADPTADVDGLDAAAKIAILASIAFNSRVTIDDVYSEGIRTIAPLDLELAEQMGYVIKLLAIANRTDGGIDVRVHPTMIPATHQLAAVRGVDNAIYVTGDAVGDTMFFGPGAGAGPAASAVVGDIIEIARNITQNIDPIVGCTCTDELPIRSLDELETQYYIRLEVQDEPGVLAATSAVFGSHDVSIYSMLQRGCEDSHVDIVFVTHPACEKDVREALEEISELDSVDKVRTIIRVEGTR